MEYHKKHLFQNNIHGIALFSVFVMICVNHHTVHFEPDQQTGLAANKQVKPMFYITSDLSGGQATFDMLCPFFNHTIIPLQFVMSGRMSTLDDIPDTLKYHFILEVT